MDKLTKRNHRSPEAVRRELLVHGYWQAHSPPGMPEKWVKGKQAVAIQREERPRSTVWHVVDYPTIKAVD